MFWESLNDFYIVAKELPVVKNSLSSGPLFRSPPSPPQFALRTNLFLSYFFDDFPYQYSVLYCLDCLALSNIIEFCQHLLSWSIVKKLVKY